ncbi:hypothetical protein [Niemeyer virus]|uniref:NADAR domain-containing protein n=1 Tax=Acanthamoeba polyphaga mimivirus Kroon TaxID=3069720 RepID=A0A0G2Y3I4_9VIRU|nr:hypothetical protein QJ850_gp346 [Acanthamoeba polyphaga mimivirus]AKI80353.1 hypothetical protein [Acanthamoeba polyphaga mimivirus Kroon]ALR84288.1 hypothetical protein [Niemeyer virus]
METDKYVFFHGANKNQAGVHIFSQWFPVNFKEYLNGEVFSEYVSAEQYMMAHKALLFGDTFHFKKIMECSKQCKIKYLGRRVRNFNPTVWDKNKFDIVTEGNRLKFSQNPDLMKRLLETGNKTIVEASPSDKIWGIGLTAQQAVNIPENKWPGKNLLGKVLMKVREENQQ